MHFIACTFRGNNANMKGGALAVTAGLVLLSEGTLLTGNTAGGSGALAMVTGGRVIYSLPAPLGRWIRGPTGQQQLNDGATDGDFPYPCAPGLYGDTTETSAQDGPQCTGLCPEGKGCAGATVVPEDCTRGTYCPIGSMRGIPCKGRRC